MLFQDLNTINPKDENLSQPNYSKYIHKNYQSRGILSNIKNSIFHVTNVNSPVKIDKSSFQIIFPPNDLNHKETNSLTNSIDNHLNNCDTFSNQLKKSRSYYAQGDYISSIQTIISLNHIENKLSVDSLLSNVVSDWIENCTDDWNANRVNKGDKWIQDQLEEVKQNLIKIKIWASQKLNNSNNLLKDEFKSNTEGVINDLIKKCDSLLKFYKSGYGSFGLRI